MVPMVETSHPHNRITRGNPEILGHIWILREKRLVFKNRDTLKGFAKRDLPTNPADPDQVPSLSPLKNHLAMHHSGHFC